MSIVGSLLLIFIAGLSASAQEITNKVLLTDEEKNWIATHSVVNSSNNTANAPIDFVSAGAPAGLSIDYLNLIANKVGLKINYVNYATWSDSLDAAKNKELDLIHTISLNDERAKFFNFSDTYYNIPLAMYGQLGSARINSMDDLRDKRIGLIKGYIVSEAYKRKYPDLNYVDFSNELEVIRALSLNNIDIYSGEVTVADHIISQNNIINLEIVGEDFILDKNVIDLHIAVHKENPTLMNIINKGMASVTDEEFKVILDKWLKSSDDTVDGIDLTLEEQTWLAENKTIRVAVSLETSPYEFLNEKSNISGITGSFLKELSKILNVDFVWSGNTTWNDGLSKLQFGDAEIASYATVTPEREKYLTFADSYLRDQQVIFAREEQASFTGLEFMDGAVIAQTKGSAIAEFIKVDYPNIIVRTVNDNIEALKLVSIGEADAFISSIPATSAYLTSENINNVRVTGSTPYNVDNGIAVRSDLPLLFSSIQKALRQIDQNTRNGILAGVHTVPYEKQTDYGPILYVVGLATIAALLILIWNKQLMTARKEAVKAKLLAEEANEAKSKFLASMSHELRTPLNAVLGFAQMLKLNPKDAPNLNKDEYVDHILEGGNHLLKLINDVLDLSQIEARQLNLHIEGVASSDIINNILSSIVSLSNARNIMIVNNLSDDKSPKIKADETRLKQCLYNLLSNAIKYNIEGGTITIDGNETEDGFYRISITDTGLGIAKVDCADVFQMFQRLDESPHIANEGTGIGLAVTKLLMELMAGRIGFESEVNVGTTFWLEFPRYQAI